MKKYFIALLFISVLISKSSACTGITLKVNGKNVVFARTLEFSKNSFEYDIALIPRNYKFIGTTPDNRPGLNWKAKYGHVAFVQTGGTQVFSGLNEAGLAYNIFYLPGYTEYQKYIPKMANKTIAPIELGSWILSNFSTIKEVRDNINKIIVTNVVYPPLNFVPPIHAAIMDKNGNSIVIEYIKGKLSIFNNTFGVITNAPNFDWHITNVKNYINLKPENINPVKIAGKTIRGLGCGSGALGLPGDLTPPSRFIRALFMSINSATCANANEAVFRAFHILNNFDIPEGMVIEKFNDKWVPETTHWTSATDFINLRFFFHLHDNRQIRMIDLKELNFNSSKVKIYKLPKKETVIDISKSFK